MNVKKLLLVSVALSFSGFYPPVFAAVQDLRAFVREGQTFLTWQEDESDWYYVYASATPIKSLKNRKWIAKIPKGSNRFRFPSLVSHKGHTGKIYRKLFEGKPWADRIQIESSLDSSKGLPDGTGLFVRTIKRDATTYYAVTSSEEATITPNQNSQVIPVDEKRGLPGATLLYKEQNLHYFVFFTDFETWNKDGIDDHMHG